MTVRETNIQLKKKSHQLGYMDLWMSNIEETMREIGIEASFELPRNSGNVRGYVVKAGTRTVVVITGAGTDMVSKKDKGSEERTHELLVPKIIDLSGILSKLNTTNPIRLIVPHLIDEEHAVLQQLDIEKESVNEFIGLECKVTDRMLEEQEMVKELKELAVTDLGLSEDEVTGPGALKRILDEAKAKGCNKVFALRATMREHALETKRIKAEAYSLLPILELDPTRPLEKSDEESVPEDEIKDPKANCRLWTKKAILSIANAGGIEEAKNQWLPLRYGDKEGTDLSESSKPKTPHKGWKDTTDVIARFLSSENPAKQEATQGLQGTERDRTDTAELRSLTTHSNQIGLNWIPNGLDLPDTELIAIELAMAQNYLDNLKSGTLPRRQVQESWDDFRHDLMERRQNNYNVLTPDEKKGLEMIDQSLEKIVNDKLATERIR